MSRRRPEARADELLDAATAVFRRQGVPGTTVADIATEAGVAKGTFYLYFESREQLVGALKSRFVDELLTRVGAFGVQIGVEDWWVLADRFVASMVDHLIERRDLIVVLASEASGPGASEVFADAQRRVDEFIAAGLRAGIAAGAYATSDPDVMATLLQHAIAGSVEHHLLYDVDVERERLVEGAQELVRKALAP